LKSTDRLIFVNELKQEIELSFFSVYFLKDLKEEVENEIVDMKAVGKDGYAYNSSTLSSRQLTILGMIKIGRNIDLLERRLRTVFNPKLSGKLIYRSIEDEKVIDVRVESLIEFNRSKGVSSFTIELIAHNPFWRAVEKTEYLALLSGKLTFPLVIPRGTGIMFGLRQSILETEIENVGDVESGFRVVFKAKGIVSNPEIENKLTGEKIKILVDMEKSDIVEVVNQPFKKMVYINGVKAFRNLDRLNSSFFNLEVGKNLIGYHAEVNAINLDVVVYYAPLYLGR